MGKASGMYAGTIGDENVARGVSGHIGRTVEKIRGLSRAIACCHTRRNTLRFHFAPLEQCDVSFGVEFDDHVTHLVNRLDMSAGSTRTWAAAINPCAKGRMVPTVTVGCPVRV